MKKTVMLLLAAASMANAADIRIEADAQTLRASDIQWLRGDEGTIQVDFFAEGDYTGAYTNSTSWLWWGTNGLASDAIEYISVAGENVFNIASTNLFLQSPFQPGFFTYGVGFGNKTYGIGRMFIAANPRVDGVALNFSKVYSVIGVTQWLGVNLGPLLPDGVTITWTENADGTYTLSATGVSTVDWDAVQNKPDTFPPSTHSHAIADVTGLQSALDGKLATVTSDATLSGAGTVASPLAVATNIVSGAASGATAAGWGDHAQAGYLTSFIRSIVAAGDRVSVVAETNGTVITYTVTADAPDLSGYVQETDAAYLAAVTNLTGSGGITISGTGRTRDVSGAGLVQTNHVGDVTIDGNITATKVYGGQVYYQAETLETYETNQVVVVTGNGTLLYQGEPFAVAGIYYWDGELTVNGEAVFAFDGNNSLPAIWYEDGDGLGPWYAYLTEMYGIPGDNFHIDLGGENYPANITGAMTPEGETITGSASAQYYAAYVTTNFIPVWRELRMDLFTGSGTTGLVASAAGDAGKYLKADGSWDTPTDTDTTDHTALDNLSWTASGHTGTAARVAIFSEGGAAGLGTLGSNLSWDGDTINASGGGSADSYYGPAYDWGATNAITFLPTKFVNWWTLDGATNTFTQSTDPGYLRATYTLYTVGTNTVVWSGVSMESWTVGATNRVIIGPGLTSTNWFGKGAALQ